MIDLFEMSEYFLANEYLFQGIESWYIAFEVVRKVGKDYQESRSVGHAS